MKLEKIAYNVYYMTNISFSIYENNIKIYETNHLLLPEIFVSEIESEKQAIIENHKDNKIVRIQNNCGFTFICLFLYQKNVVFGPFLINDDYENFIDEIIFKYHLINEEAQMVENYYNSMKILSEFQQTFIVNILHGLEVLDLEKMKIYNIQVKKFTNSSNHKQVNDYTLKQIESSHEVEEMLLSIVRNGDIDVAKSFDFQNISNQHLIYKNNSFTNMKTNLMIFDALCNREAIKAGVDPLLANKISNNIKFYINKISLSSELKFVAQKILTTYAKAVKDYTLLNYSSNIKKIILYIRKNLTYKISLDDIAIDLFITKEHLSRLFKKEMGITISEYIIKAKIQEAKKLLKQTDYNILDIAVLLNFANSSHFSNSFKKITGLSPSDYRKNPND
ncbi:MAG: AraC family transcriptional regulator [Candidatus Izemoplasmatales bacterium]|nr:AraC family transcriptional regulator [Candidatus Izemoplasmatales bacterium]